MALLAPARSFLRGRDIEPQEASRLIGRYIIAYMIRARSFQWSVALLALLALAVVLISTWSLSRDTTATAMGHQVLVPRWWTVDNTDLGVEERPLGVGAPITVRLGHVVEYGPCSSSATEPPSPLRHRGQPLKWETCGEAFVVRLASPDAELSITSKDLQQGIAAHATDLQRILDSLR